MTYMADTTKHKMELDRTLYGMAFAVEDDDGVYHRVVPTRVLVYTRDSSPSERLEAEAIVNGYLAGGPPPFDGWHHIDNAHNDLLREVIKQLVEKLVGG